jgi:rRNA maturation endonuclease Nob1
LDAEVAAREAADSALDGRLDILEGADTVSGSVAKALKDAKAYTDSEVANEASERTTADNALQDQIDTINAVVHEKEKFVLSNADISNGYINLSHMAIEKSILVTVDRLVAHAGDDYTLSVVSGATRITFAGDMAASGAEELVAGDVVRVMYRYQG